jgi:DNA-binding MarR family transcriptional regulator
MEESTKSLQVIRTFKQIMDSMKANIEKQYKDENFTGPQGMLICILIKYGDMKIGDLSEKLGLSNSTVSGIIDRLEKQGVLERIRSLEDRRVVYVKVKPEFSVAAKTRFNEIESSLESKMSKASPEELNLIYDGLHTLKKLLD